MRPLFPQLLNWADVALLLMRLLVGWVFVDSGLKHVRDPAGRGASIGLSPGFTRFLGLAEIAGGLGVALGVLAQVAAIGLILIMAGATYKKVAEWHTGFWGDKNSGWHYELLFIVMNLVILTTAGGRFVIL